MRKTFTILLALLCCGKSSAQFSPDTVFTHVDLMPYFGGCGQMSAEAKRRCSDSELVRFLSKRLVYPQAAREQSIEGTVYVSFVLDEQGRVTQPRLLKDIGAGCGEAALDVLGEMPAWEPGIQQRQKVKVRLNLPVAFSLRQPGSDDAENYQLAWGDLHGDSVSVEALQKSLAVPVCVRDPLGENRYIAELAFTFEKNKRLLNAKSRGNISPELIKIVEKSRKGGTFTLTAAVQDKGKFVYISRTYQVVE